MPDLTENARKSVNITVKESIEIAAYQARLDGIAEGVRMLTESLKAQAVDDLIASKKQAAITPEPPTPEPSTEA